MSIISAIAFLPPQCVGVMPAYAASTIVGDQAATSFQQRGSYTGGGD